jgi:hypothetical protein
MDRLIAELKAPAEKARPRGRPRKPRASEARP